MPPTEIQLFDRRATSGGQQPGRFAGIFYFSQGDFDASIERLLPPHRRGSAHGSIILLQPPLLSRSMRDEAGARVGQ